jgi:O-antigen ligase
MTGKAKVATVLLTTFVGLAVGTVVALVETLGGAEARTLLETGIAAMLVLILLIAVRRAGIGASMRPLEYFGMAALGLAVLLITFNALRVGTHVTASDLFLLVAAAMFVLSALADRVVIQSIPRWLILGSSGLLVAGFLAALTSTDVGTDVIATGEFALALLGVPVLVALGTVTLPRLLFIAKLWLLSATLNAGIALTDFTHLTGIGPAILGTVYSGRPTGLTVHPNHLGIVCAMAIPIGLVLLTRARKAWAFSVYLPAVLVLSAGVLVSGSRAALLAGIAGGLLLPAVGHRLWKPVVVVSFAAAAILLVTSATFAFGEAPSFTNPFVAIQRITTPASTTSSDTTRLQYYGAALTDFATHPLTGVGFDVVRGAHDIYLQLLEAGGVLALLAFVVFSAGSLRRGLLLSRDADLDHESRNLASAFTVSVLIWLLAGLVQNFIYDRFLYVPVGLIIGLGLASVRRSAVGVERSPESTNLNLYRRASLTAISANKLADHPITIK